MKKVSMLLAALFAMSLYHSEAFAEFKSEDEAAVISTTGNSEFKTYALKSVNSYKLNANTVGLKGIYTYGESEKVRNAENWQVQLTVDHAFNEKISLVAGELVEANRFAGVSRRYNTDLGMKYNFVKNDNTQALLELAYRYTDEKNVSKSVADKKDSKAKVYVEASHKFNANVSGKFWLEYLPNFSESEDYQINLEPSLAVVMTEVLSLKVAYLWNYDHEPATGSVAHDTKYVTSIIAKF